MVGLKMELLEIHTTKVPHLKNVTLKESNQLIGYFIREVDGLFNFYKSDKCYIGLTSQLLQEIADKLDRINNLFNTVLNNGEQ